MSFVVANPDFVSQAAGNLARISSTLNEANSAAAGQTIGVAAAAEDEISAAVAAFFGTYGQAYQSLSAQATAFHEQFVQNLLGGAQAYSAAEAASAGPLQPLFDAINGPARALLGRPLIGDGNNGATPGAAGEDGGLLFGNGGNGANGAARPAGRAGGVPRRPGVRGGRG